MLQKLRHKLLHVSPVLHHLLHQKHCLFRIPFRKRVRHFKENRLVNRAHNIQYLFQRNLLAAEKGKALV